MTDDTQPEAMDLADWLEAVGGGGLSPNRCAALLREQHARIAELESELEAMDAGGVQALSAAPEAIAKLRHLYQNMVNGAVRDTASAKRIAEGLLAPAIEALERTAPPAKQQAAPKAAPVELSADSLRHQNKLLAETLGACILASGIVRKDIDGFTGAELLHFGEDLRSMLEAAPQQEAQEPCSTCAALARTVMLDQVSFDRKPDCYGIRQITDDEGVEEWEDIRTSPDVAREEANDMMATGRGEIYEVVPLWTTPQPAPAPLSDDVVRDAAFDAVRKKLCALPRFSFLSDGYGVRRVPDKSGSWIAFDAAHALFDPVAVDAALAAQGGKV